MYSTQDDEQSDNLNIKEHKIYQYEITLNSRSSRRTATHKTSGAPAPQPPEIRTVSLPSHQVDLIDLHLVHRSRAADRAQLSSTAE